MAKEKKKEEGESPNLSPTQDERICGIDSFLEEHSEAKKRDSNIGPGFKAWFIQIKKKSAHVKLPVSQWENLLKNFLTEEVR